MLCHCLNNVCWTLELIISNLIKRQFVHFAHYLFGTTNCRLNVLSLYWVLHFLFIFMSFSPHNMTVFCQIAASLLAVFFFFLNIYSFLRLPLATSFSVSSLEAVPRWEESNLNYVSQGPIPLLPAVGISDLLISYQPVIGLRSLSPSDIP